MALTYVLPPSIWKMVPEQKLNMIVIQEDQIYPIAHPHPLTSFPTRVRNPLYQDQNSSKTPSQSSSSSAKEEMNETLRSAKAARQEPGKTVELQGVIFSYDTKRLVLHLRHESVITVLTFNPLLL